MSRGFWFVITIIVIGTVLGILSLKYFPTSQPQTQIPPQNLPSPISPTGPKNYVQGEFVISFKNGVSETDARALLQKYNLQPKVPENFFTYLYITVSVNSGDIDAYAQQIQALHMTVIKSVNVYGKDQSGVRPWITVDFDPRATLADVNKILAISPNISLNNSMGGPETLYEISVPVGKEQYFANLFAKENLIKASMLNYTAHIN